MYIYSNIYTMRLYLNGADFMMTFYAVYSSGIFSAVILNMDYFQIYIISIWIIL